MKKNSWCSPSKENRKINTLSEAKSQCNDEPRCRMIIHYTLYDHGRLFLERFSFCHVGARIRAGFNNILYTKRLVYEGVNHFAR